jgi:hypothetical protein
MAFYETVMVKGYQTLVDPDTTVDVTTGMLAAGRLQALLDTRSGRPDMAEIMVKMNRIIDAVKSMVPESSWPESLRRLEGDPAPAERSGCLGAPSGLAVEEYDPLEGVDDEDDLDEWT